MDGETVQADDARRGRRVRRVALGVSAVLVAGGLAAAAPSAFASDEPAPNSAPCESANLTITWQGTSSGMQKHSGNLIFTNTGDTTCQLAGYPTLTYVDATGASVGLPAQRFATDGQSEVTLTPGGTTTAQVRRVNAEAFDEVACQAVTTAGISVLPPGNTTAILLPGSATACSGDIGRSLLDIGPIGSSFPVEN